MRRKLRPWGISSCSSSALEEEDRASRIALRNISLPSSAIWIYYYVDVSEIILLKDESRQGGEEEAFFPNWFMFLVFFFLSGFTTERLSGV
jgi:hypothetical protein